MPQLVEDNVLTQALKVSPATAQAWSGPLSAAMALYDITTPVRIAGFLGQVAVESGCFQWLREIWGPTPAQRRYERNFSAAWPPTNADPTNRQAYWLGNDQVGDGFTYRGAGLLQVTGKTHFKEMSQVLNHDFVAAPADLATPSYAALSAADFWNTHGLNSFADSKDWTTITKRINGGLNAYAQRLHYTTSMLQALGVT